MLVSAVAEKILSYVSFRTSAFTLVTLVDTLYDGSFVVAFALILFGLIDLFTNKPRSKFVIISMVLAIVFLIYSTLFSYGV